MTAVPVGGGGCVGCFSPFPLAPAAVVAVVVETTTPLVSTLERGPQALPRRVVADAADHRRRVAQAGGGRGLVASLGL